MVKLNEEFGPSGPNEPTIKIYGTPTTKIYGIGHQGTQKSNVARNVGRLQHYPVIEASLNFYKSTYTDSYESPEINTRISPPLP